MPITPVNVNVPRDLTSHADNIKEDAAKLRDELGGMSNAERAKLFGHIGDSHIAPDFFDKKINDNDEQALVQLAGMMGASKALSAVAKQGAEDPGAGLLHRSDRLGSYLGGYIRSLAVIQGTATKGANGEKVKGDGAKLQVQVEYEATRAETRKIMDVMGRDAVKLDTDGSGKPLQLKARLNLDAKITETGIRDIHFSASIDHVPAIDALKLLKEIGDDEIEFPAALPLKVLMQNNSEFSMNFLGREGANIGLKANLSALNELDDSDRVPDALLSANADGDMIDVDGKQFLDFGKLDVSLDSKMNVLWDDAGNITLEIQDDEGKYVPYDTQSNLGMPLNDGMVMMLIAAAAQGMP